mmetsp:Transcript_121515/g.338544  ORF Transcript_121515/g.338544 Transcript_121515/m.338544 type:complete len:243 (-) Transcript_121515:162-890(-)
MPIEILARCTCSWTRPGDEVVLVGGHPKLGEWDPAKSSAVLSTTPQSFPCWELPIPVLLEAGPCGSLGENELELRLEYRYVIRRSAGGAGQRFEVEWEELRRADACDGSLDLPTDVGGVTIEEPDCSNRVVFVSGDCVLYICDDFGWRRPVAPALWRVHPDWSPGIVGGGSTLGVSKLRNSGNPAFEMQYRFPLQKFVTPRRARLEKVLQKLTHRRGFPPGVWIDILSWIDTELARHCCPFA